jgi:vesicle coat complex subunit
VALQIAERGQAGNDALIGLLSTADDDRLRAIIFALSSHPGEPMRIRNLLMDYLRDQRPLIVAEAVDGLAALDARDATEQVLALQDHPSPYVRGGVLRFMARLHPDEARELLIDALSDPDYIVRENAIDELQEIDATDALPSLEPLLHDPHPYVRQAAETAVAGLQAEKATRSGHE